DAAYEAFISDPALPHSIYEIEGASTCAIELCSLSKTAGFTGTRCGYTTVPFALTRGGVSLNKMWLRNRATRFNGTSYIIQKGAEAVFTPAGRAETREGVAYYMGNAALIGRTLDSLHIRYFGGKNAPYIWMECPKGLSSWAFFDKLLAAAEVVGTPGSGFGRCGEGYLRLTAFGDREKVEEACGRLAGVL
ncbi:MAG: aminotransferase class I/II-fold pyridoxal phosphate-dependent enzyme, partial [Clostridiales bacterium]|nr:aminotransferase class I/II-fold pyridoxal phosphate-dependent enzyme [Clostridiales bacterium]